MCKRIGARGFLFGLFLFFLGNSFAQPDFFKFIPDTSINAANNLWMSSVKTGKWDSAAHYAMVMERLAKKEFGETNSYHAAALACRGYTYAVTGDCNNAYKCLKQGVDIFAVLKDTSTESYTYQHLYLSFYYGMVCQTLGADAESEPYLIKAGELMKRKGDMPNYVQSMLTLAVVYCNKGEYARAEAIDLNMIEVLDTMPKTGFTHYLLGALYNNIAVIYTQTGNLRKSLGYMQQSEEIEKVPLTGVGGSDYLAIVLNLAEAYANCDFTDSALAKCKQVEDSLVNKKNGTLYAGLLKARAKVYQQQNRLSEAISLYEAFKNMSDTLSVKPNDFDIALINLGVLYIDTRQYGLADSLFKQEIKRLHRSGLDYTFEMQQSMSGLCANLMALKKYKEAADSLLVLCHLTFSSMKKNFPGMSETDQLNYRAALDGFFDLLYSCMREDKSLKNELITATFALELQRKNLVLTNQIQLLNKARHSQDGELLALYRAWLNNRQMLSKQYSLPSGDRLLDTDSLEYLSEKLEKAISARGLTPIVVDGNISPARLLAKQRRQSANIEFVRYNYKSVSGKSKPAYAAFVFRYGDTIPVFVHLCSEQALMQLMKDKKGEWIDNNELTRKLYNAASAGAGSLYQLIWKPMEPYLKGTSSIDYSPAGLYNNIALNAVYDGKGYLMNRYTLHRYASLLEADEQKISHERPDEICIWGNMNYDSSAYASAGLPKAATSLIPSGMKAVAQAKNMTRAPLQPFDPAEVSGIKEIFHHNHIRVRSVEYDYATEENFKQYAAEIKGILHISTHGFYTPLDRTLRQDNFINGRISPLFRCGLAFSGVNYYWIKGVPRADHEDGILTGYEVAQLDLHHVQLVTLSACETGLGDVTANEGNLGLERAFKLAGARNLLVSLWEVPAKQTAELLSLFYTNWLNGKTPAEALQMAEHSMQKKNYPPFFWAGFVLIE